MVILVDTNIIIDALANREPYADDAKRIMEIISDLDPMEKDVYIKKASENTGIKEQTLYDILKSKMKDNRENNFRNNKEEDRSKLYVEPGFLKAERAILKIMLKNKEYLLYIV